MKILPSNSTLLVIDVQERLMREIYESKYILFNIEKAINLAVTIGIPILLTEHCPEKIGSTPQIIRKKIKEENIVTKVFFSAVREGSLLNKMPSERKQIIVAGTEAHVGVLQTVLDLLELGYKVFVIDSCVGSQKSDNKIKSIERMSQNGAEIITLDMLAFEWLEQAETKLFKEVLTRFL